MGARMYSGCAGEGEAADGQEASKGAEAGEALKGGPMREEVAFLLQSEILLLDLGLLLLDLWILHLS
uniref:Uncharacterized protein n=1 Tax=Arundo donax TaxID=35708 RepID=A0A0A9FHC9_ARUDO